MVSAESWLDRMTEEWLEEEADDSFQESTESASRARRQYPQRWTPAALARRLGRLTQALEGNNDPKSILAGLGVLIDDIGGMIFDRSGKVRPLPHNKNLQLARGVLTKTVDVILRGATAANVRVRLARAQRLLADAELARAGVRDL